jgi:hypothetical protein
MRTLLVAPLAIVFAVSLSSYAGVGISVDINVDKRAPAPAPAPMPPPAPEGYAVGYENDDDMYRDDLVVIDRTTIGFWVVLPSGHRVLHCRSLWWDRRAGDWYYGPWHDDPRVAYVSYQRGPYWGVHFYDYMSQHYPKYYERRLRHDHEMRLEQRRHEKGNDRDKHDYIDKRKVEKADDHDRGRDKDHGHGHDHD